MLLLISNANTGNINEFNAFVPAKADTVKLIANFFNLKDTLAITVLAPPLANAFNYTIASGKASNPAIWSRGIIPGLLDSVVVKSGHIVTVDTLLQVRYLFVEPGGKVEVNAGDTLNIVPIDIIGYVPFKLLRGKLDRIQNSFKTTACYTRVEKITYLVV